MIKSYRLCSFKQSKLVSIVDVTSIRTYTSKTNKLRNIYTTDRKVMEEHIHINREFLLKFLKPSHLS